MSIEHTPGPWTVNGSAIEADDQVIAHIYDPDDNGPDEYAANAHLISTAPELLAACEAVAYFWGHDPEAFGDEATLNSMAGKFAAVAHLCLAAVEKAKGE